MILSVPRLEKEDIKEIGIIEKDSSKGFLVSDLYNTNENNTYQITGYGFFKYVYEVFDTYLFVIDNAIYSKDVKPKDVDFIAKILKFEYLLQRKPNLFKKLEMPNKILTLTTNLKWLQDDLIRDYEKQIDFIIENNKTHLQGIQSPYIKYMSYLCDNENCIGLFEHGLSKLLYDDYVLIYKDKAITIIKTNHTKFE